jgi:hypothetical protein
MANRKPSVAEIRFNIPYSETEKIRVKIGKEMKPETVTSRFPIA